MMRSFRNWLQRIANARMVGAIFSTAFAIQDGE